MERFTGKTAAVSGAGSGIGCAVAQRFAAEGANVMCLDRNLDAAARTAATLARGAAIRCDVTDAVSCAAAVAQTVDRFDTLDVLVNVAGVAASHPIGEFPTDEWRQIIDVNLTGTFLLSQAALAPLLHSTGTIVNMASVAGMRATPYNAAYCASKGGVIMLTKSMAIELAKRGVRVNAVCPSVGRHALPAQFRVARGRGHAASGPGGIADGPRARGRRGRRGGRLPGLERGETITGSVLTIDGGATA